MANFEAVDGEVKKLAEQYLEKIKAFETFFDKNTILYIDLV